MLLIILDMRIDCIALPGTNHVVRAVTTTNCKTECRRHPVVVSWSICSSEDPNLGGVVDILRD